METENIVRKLNEIDILIDSLAKENFEIRSRVVKLEELLINENVILCPRCESVLLKTNKHYYCTNSECLYKKEAEQ